MDIIQITTKLNIVECILYESRNCFVTAVFTVPRMLNKSLINIFWTCGNPWEGKVEKSLSKHQEI